MKYPCIFWNVQRLFEFDVGNVGKSLGITNKSWSKENYNNKIISIANCLSRMTNNKEPALLAFAEVETLKVVKDIVELAGWKNMVSVDEIITPPHLEGHDIALLFNNKIFNQNKTQSISYTLNNNFKTRDLLYANLEFLNASNTLSVFVTHWPSRMYQEAIILRMAHSFYLKNLVRKELLFEQSDLLKDDGEFHMPEKEELLKKWNIPLIIMGDFNDEPWNESVLSGIEASRSFESVIRTQKLTGKSLTKPENYLTTKIKLYNPSWQLNFSDNDKPGGTFYRSPEWSTYDQLIVNSAMLKAESKIHLIPNTIKIPRLKEFKAGTKKIKMITRSGLPNKFDTKTNEGVSDHFPLYYEIEIVH